MVKLKSPTCDSQGMGKVLGPEGTSKTCPDPVAAPPNLPAQNCLPLLASCCPPEGWEI